MAATVEVSSPSGDRKVVTVLFADLSGSTSMQERLDAEATARLMARVQQVLGAAVETHGGRVVKSTGDGLMAVFGVPIVREDDAVRAVRAGVAMQASFAGLALADVALRVGINTGEVVVASDTDDVVGDPVNVAARLEAAADLGEVLVGPETQRLVRDAFTVEVVEPLTLRGKSEPVPAARVVRESAAGTTATPFLGREADIAALLAAFDEAVAARAARLVTVLGWPGLGKSRLAAELAAAVATRATVVEARFVADGGSSFGPIADALRRAVDPDTLDLGADGERVVATIDALLGGRSAGSTEQVFWAMRRTLEALAGDRPALVVLDDLHWAEPAMLDLVEHLAEWLRDAPVLLLVLARPELRDRRSALVDVTGPSSSVVVLAGLDADASAQLARDVLDAEDLPPGVVERTLEASEGNPLFLRELLRLLVDDGVLVQGDDRCWSLTVEFDAIELPATIHAALAARIEQLDPDERAVLQVASVIGRHFPRGAVAALLPPGVAARLDEHLGSLHRRALVDPEGTWWADERLFRFHHVLIRDAAYRRVLKEVRAHHHVRYADWLVERAGEPTGEHDEVLGFHLEQAIGYGRELGHDADPSLMTRAVGHLATAGRRALGRDDLANAAALLGRALTLAPSDPDLLRDRCEALVSSGDVHAATDVVAALAASAHDERSRALADVFDAQLAGQRTPESLRDVAARAASAASVLAAHGDDVGVAHAESVQATALAGLGQVAACEAALDRSLAAARRAGDTRRANVVLSIAPAAALWGPSPIARASGRCLDVVRVLRITSWAPHVEAHALRHQAVLEALRDRADAARRMLATARATFTDLGHRLGLLETAMHEGLVELLDGRPDAAEQVLRGAVAGFEAMGSRGRTAQATALLARALLELDRVDDAAALADPLLAGDDLKALNGLLCVAAEVSARRGETDEALALAQRAVSLAETTDALVDHADARLSLARVLHLAGRLADAAAERERARALYEQKGATVGARRAGDVVAPAAPDGPVATWSKRRVTENLATRLLTAWSTTWRTADWFTGRYTPEAVVEHHQLQATIDVASQLAGWREIAGGDAEMQFEILASLGERHVLFRQDFGWDTGASQLSWLGIWRVTADGRLSRSDIIEPDRLGFALSCLVQRWAEDELEGATRERALASSASFLHDEFIYTRDWESERASWDAHAVLVDHRTTGREVRGPDALTAGVQQLAESADRLEGRLEDVLALTPNATLWRWLSSGERSGGQFTMPTFIVARVGPRGPFDRMEFFREEDLDDAWASFDRLNGGDVAPGGRRVQPNAASRSVERWVAAVHAGDLVAARETRAAELEVVATLGERHSLTRALVRFREDGRAGEVTNLLVRRVDVNGLATVDEPFAVDQLAAAGRRLVELWAEDELHGAVRERVLRSLVVWSIDDATAARDWQRYAALFAADVELTDHRGNGITARGREGIVDWLRELIAPTEWFETRLVDVLGLTADAMLWRRVTVGEREGGSFERPSLNVLRLGADGLVDRVDFFAPEQIDDAWTVFDSYVTPSRAWRRVSSTMATRTAERWADAARRGDDEALEAGYAPGYTLVHHGLHAELGRDYTAAAEDAARNGSVLDLEVVAALGERHVLTRVLAKGADEEFLTGQAEYALYIVNRMDAEGRSLLDDVFDDDQLARALGCLVERWSAEELPEREVTRARRTAAAWGLADAINSRDWPTVAAVHEQAVQLVDRRRAGVTVHGAADVVEWLRAGVEDSELFTVRLDDVLALTPDVALARWHAEGAREGAPFSLPSYIVTVFGATGGIGRVEIFEMEALDEAWACFDGAVGAAQPRRRRARPNLGTRYGQRWRDAIAGGRSTADLKAPAYQHVEHDLRIATDLGRTQEMEATPPNLVDVALEPVASLGERHALHRVRIVYDIDGAAIAYEAYNVASVDSGGLGILDETFAADRLGDAVAKLVELWAEDEAPTEAARQQARRTAGYHRHAEAIDERDWAALRCRYADGAVVVDHRPAGAGELIGADAIVDWFRTFIESAETLSMAMVEVFALEVGRVVAQWRSRGVAAGVAFETDPIIATRFSEGGLIERVEFFAPDRVDDALEVFDGWVSAPSRRRVPPNEATAFLERWLTTLNEHDESRVRELFASDAVMVGHSLRTDYSSEALHDLTLQLVRTNTGCVTAPLASLGRRHVLARLSTPYRDDVGGAADIERLVVIRTNDGGLACRFDSFPPDRLADALACLVERWAEDELDAAGQARARRIAAIFRRAETMLTRDWDALGDHYTPTILTTEHHLLGGESVQVRGRAAMVDWARALVTDAERLVLGYRDVLALTPDSLLVHWDAEGTRDGAQFAHARLIACRLDDNGRIDVMHVFDAEDADDAWAAYDELVVAARASSPRRVRSNLATAARDRWAAALRAGDVDAVMATKRHDYVMVHHGMQSTFDSAEHRARIDGLGPATVEQELLAMLGEHHSLHRVHLGWVRPDGGPVQFDLLGLCRVDGNGLVVHEENFEAEHLNAALRCLFERWAEDELDDAERERTLRIARFWSYGDLVAAQDWDAYGDVLALDAVQVDHRPTGIGEIRGRDVLVAWIRELAAVSEHVRADVADVLALTSRAALIRNIASGTAAGGTFRIPSLTAFSFGDDGRATRVEFFPEERTVDAWACFDRLDGVTAVPPSNAAAVLVSQWAAAANAGDIDAAAALYAPGYELVRHDQHLTEDRSMWLDTERLLVARSRVHIEPIAARGERHALTRVVTEVDGGDVRLEALYVARADTGGHLVREDMFRVDQLPEALACLIVRHAEEELAHDPVAFERAMVIADGCAAAIDQLNQHDWRAVRRRYHDDALLIDHRPGSIGIARGADAIVEWHQGFSAVADSWSVEVREVLVASGDRFLVACRVAGLAYGAPYENLPFVLLRVGADGLIFLEEQFGPDQREDALRRVTIDEPAPRSAVRPNLAWAAVQRWARLARAGDMDGIRDLYSPTYQLNRRDHHIEVDRADHTASEAKYVELGADARVDHLVTLGERVDLHRLTLEWDQDDAGEIIDHEFLVVTTVGADGRYLTDDLFPPDQLDQALACAVQRWADAELAGAARERAIGSIPVFLNSRYADARDWDRYRSSMTADVVLVDHRPTAVGEIVGADAVVGFIGGIIAYAPDLRTETVCALAVTENAYLCRWHASGTVDGGQFELPSLLAMRLGPDGPMDRIHVFPHDRLDDAWACFDVLDRPARPAARRSPPNLATAALDASLAVVSRGGVDAAAHLYSPDYIVERHDLLVRFNLDTDRDEERRMADETNVGVEIIVSLGRRHCLYRFSSERPADQGGGEARVVALVVCRVDEGGRFVHEDLFRDSDLVAACRCLVERWAEVELGGGPSGLLAAGPFDLAEAMSTGDWSRVAEWYDGDAVAVDHRATVNGALVGRDAIVESARTVELVDETHNEIGDVLALAPSAALLEWRATGKRDGSQWTYSILVATLLDAAGRIVRAEYFDPEQSDEAWACFDGMCGDDTTASPSTRERRLIADSCDATEPGDAARRPSGRDAISNSATSAAAPPVVDNAAVRMYRDWTHAIVQGDLDTAIALGSEGGTGEDRRALMRTPQSADPDRRRREITWLIEQQIDSVSVEPVATRGERLAVDRARFRSPAGEVEVLNLTELDEAHERITAGVVFDPDDLDAAISELDRRAAQLAHDAVCRAHNDRDPQAFRAGFTDDAVVVNHKPAGFGEVSADEFTALTVSLWSLHQANVHGRVEKATPRVALVHSVTDGPDNDGGRMEIDSVVVLQLATDGRVARLDTWDPEQREEAEASYASTTSRSAPRQTENRAGPNVRAPSG